MKRLWAVIAAVAALAVLGTASVRAQDAEFDGRPVLEDAQTFGTEHFVVHYTLSGVDAVPEEDEDGDGTPDYVTFVAEVLEDAYATQVEAWGWAAPPPDGDRGGDARLDVYLTQLMSFGVAGFVSPEGGWVGDNPTTQALERDAAFSFMVLDNDYAEATDFDPTLDEGEILDFAAAVIVHEFNHMVQSGYNGFNESIWLYEATATWTEAETFGDAEYALGYLPYVLKSPDYCLSASSGRGADGLRWYGSWLFMRHLSDTYGRDVVRTIWEELRQQSAVEAINAALAPFESTLEEETLAYGVRNLLRAYAQGEDIPTVRLEGESGVGLFRPTDGVQPLGVDYVRLDALEPLTLTLFDTEAPMTLRIVALRQGGGADVFLGGRTVSADLTGYEAAFALVHHDEASLGACEFADYRLTVAQATEDALYIDPEAVTEINFAEPVVGDEAGDAEGLLRVDRPFISDEAGRYSEQPELVEASFTPVVPLPVEGYDFDFGRVRDADSFGRQAEYYLPDGDDAVVYDYEGTDDETWLRVTQSATQFESLEEWLDEINYNPEGDINDEDFGPVEVLVEDLSTEESRWTVATFILDGFQDAPGLFVVVEGPEQAAVLEMVTAYLESQGTLRIAPEPVIGLPTPVPFQQQGPNVESAVALVGGVTALLCVFTVVAIGLGAAAVVLLERRVIPRP